ncbi:hypothetical protein RUM43_011026 [Polyplax serrata]|uniref:Uncharacterized protein n=1 Tax=Polyplax serrata TaxID=468196 RepID=A0AAN8S7N5_POLSC
MKEDKEQALGIEVDFLHTEENSVKQKDSKDELDNEVLMSTEENHFTKSQQVDVEENLFKDNKLAPVDVNVVSLVETKVDEDIEKSTLENETDNIQSDGLNDIENTCQTKLSLRSRKTEINQNGEENYNFKKSKNVCQKTEKKCAIKKDDTLGCNEINLNNDTLLVSSTDEDLVLTPDLPSESKEGSNNAEVIVGDIKYVKVDSVDSIQNLVATSDETEEFDSVKVPFIKSQDEGSYKSDSSNVTKESSASESSTFKIQKKRRRRREMWWTKKKKKPEGNTTRSSTNHPGGGFQGQDIISNAVQFNEVSVKRKMTDVSDGVQKKQKDFASAVPSPSLADINLKAAIPEATATSAKVSKPKLCLCRKKPNVFISGNNNTGDLYCQALDSIENRIVGCCNAIPSQDVGLYRASEKAAYQMMCNVHQQRLLRHNCCPGCGLFCTQGRYLMCKSWHHFHKTCFNDNKSGSTSCPHCGDTSLKEIVVSIHASKDPVFLPIQKPVRNMKSAKMTISRSNVQMPVDDDDDDSYLNFSTSLFCFDGDEGPLQNGMVQVLQRDKLANLLNIACRSFSKVCCGNRYTYKSLYSAAQNGDVEKLLKVIASGLNPNHVFEENNNQTALHVAAANGHLPAVHLLLQAKAEINVLDAEQNTPLTAAISAKQNDIVKYFVKCGANLILKGEDGMSPLHIAAKCGNVEACFYLLNGTHLPPRYIDGLDDGGWTPMVWASEFNHLEVVRFLIGKGADSFIKDAEQNIALHWAAFGGSTDIVEMFLNDGSDINAVNVHGDTPLHIAARQHKYSCVLLLLARGARSDLKNKNGEQARDCCGSSASDIYKGITLNMELSALLTRFQDRSPRIISNDISRGKERNQIQCVNGVDDEGEPGDFVYVSESCFTSKITVDRTINSLQSCKCRDVCSSESCNCSAISVKCWYDTDGRLKSDFNYVDPPMIFECNQACHCNRITCRNRVVQNGITCRFQLFKTEGRGWGIKTLNLIQKGTFVCEYVGEIISDWEADHREDDSYLFDLENRDGETYCIDARYYGNIARFINHMCVPNVMPVHIFVDHQDLRFPRIAFFANRDILPNEELGYNYGDKFWVIKWKSFTCVCQSEKCLYSENTIKTTLENYQKKLSAEENP